MELRDNNTRKLTSGLRRPFGVAGNLLCTVSVCFMSYCCTETWGFETPGVFYKLRIVWFVQAYSCVAELTVGFRTCMELEMPKLI